ncbi:MAG: aspartate/glutamate racemase family protein [Actinomycetota bacterium]|nr:aspartate/glutamate racemase family protein [Actinomycetota bacterium]
MGKLAAFIHTVTGLAEPFQQLATELLGDVEVFSLVDESLLRRIIRQGRLETRTMRRLAGLVASVEDEGVDAILVTCSSLGPAVEAARPLCAVPLLRVDEPMALQAVHGGDRIGVLATLSTTLEPTVGLVEQVATREGRDVAVTAQLCDGAFEAVTKGDVERHDALVRAGLERLAARVDVVVLAQASMARVVTGLPESPPIPVLSSPRSSVEQLAAVLS